MASGVEFNQNTHIESFNIANKFTDQDFDLYYKLVSNENVMAMITERAIPFEEAKQEYNKIIENNRIHPVFGNFKVQDVSSGEFIGLAKLEIKQPTDSEAELGYMLLPQYWGRGIGGKIAETLIDLARSTKDIKRVFAIIDPKNLPSRKILLNNGFKSEKFQDFDGLPGEILGLDMNLDNHEA